MKNAIQSTDPPKAEPFQQVDYRQEKPFLGKFLSRRNLPIAAVFLLMILIGTRIVTSYGQSWDEYNNFTYGESSLRSYTNGSFLQDQNEDYFHGTFYFMVFSVTSRFFSDLNSLWNLADGRHFTNYLTFLGAALCLYLLALRIMSHRWATITTLVFLTQPLYFGHAFINPKDIPFMAFFLASVTIGLAASDLWGMKESSNNEAAPPYLSSALSVTVVREWRQTRLWRRLALLLLFTLGVLVTIDLFVQEWIYPGVQDLFRQAYQGGANPVINILFSLFAGHAPSFPLEGYLEKLRIAYLWLRVPLAGLVLLPAFVFTTRVLPDTYNNLVRPWLIRYGAWGIAGVLLGLTGSIRIFGPFAGALVSIYALSHHRKRALPPLGLYWIIQAGMMYMTWPTLWGNPVGKLLERLMTASDFDPNILLFEGQHILSSQLPRIFLPRMFSLQFTEPVLILFAIGGFWVVYDSRKNRTNRFFVGLLLFWLLVPVGTQIIFRTTVYDNFRHFLFATPPLFMFAGYGMMRIVQGMKWKLAWAPAVLLVILPGILSIYKYYPYEYTYFNSLAGGVSGAYDHYELDYWCISYREAMNFINSNAPEGAAVLVLGPEEAAQEFARTDLNLVAEDASIIRLDSGEYVREFPKNDLVFKQGGSNIDAIKYVITCKSAERGVPHHPELPVVYEIHRGEAVYTTVKEVPEGYKP